MSRDRDIEEARAEAAELCEQASALAERVRSLALALMAEPEQDEKHPRPKLRVIKGGLAAILGLLLLSLRRLFRSPAAAAALAAAGTAAVVLTVVPFHSAGARPPHRVPGQARAHQRTTPGRARASRRAHGSASPQPGASRPAPAPSQRTSPLPLPVPSTSLPVPLPTSTPPLPMPTPSPTCSGIVVLGKCIPL